MTRLKLVSRQMYGCADVDLLRARKVQPAWKDLPISTNSAPEPPREPEAVTLDIDDACDVVQAPRFSD